MDFIICTEDVNRHGYRVLLSGARLDNFKKNPVMLYDHDAYREKPIGRWENLRIQDGKLIATAVFADGDEAASQVRNLVQQGALNATSMGLIPITYSSDSSMVIAGQTRETVVEWELYEVSIVPIPANPNTVKLKLSNGGSGDLPPEITKTQQEMNFDKIAQALGIADATEEAVLSALKQVQDKNVTLALELGATKGLVTDDNRTAWAALAAKDLDNTLALMQSLKGPEDEDEGDDIPQVPKAPETPPVTIQSLLDAAKKLSGNGKEDKDNPEGWDFDTWSKRDPQGLLLLKQEQPEKYATLAQGYVKK